MNILNDFSIIVWGEKAPKNLHQIPINTDDIDSFYEASAVVLCINSQNINTITAPKSFTKIAQFFHIEDYENQIQTLQLNILNSLDKKGSNKIKEHIGTLFENQIINYEQSQKIIRLLNLIKNQPTKLKTTAQKVQKPTSHKQILELFMQSIGELDVILDDKKSKKRFDLLRDKIASNRFSIGVTGVMNAGKSTMLNALLGESILGTSVVPETANLTIIKYSPSPYARVNFWNEKEWEEIEFSAQFSPPIKEFVEKSHEAFADNFSDFVTKNGKSVDIDLDRLTLYTSAKHSNSLCNLVKSVELYSDLEFVKDGVNIVDTPGLDDPVVQREEITKKYLNDCDVMIHLMNVNQSATQKDVDFIIDSLTYGHISKLLVVVTQIDTVSKNELEEVIEYTKSSIKKRLLSNESRFEKIIEKIDFLPIAGKLALMHKTGDEKEALKKGYTLEKTGIPRIEEYLFETLFSPTNEKNSIFIDAISKEFSQLVEYMSKEFSYKRSLLSKSADELEAELKEVKEQNSQNLRIATKIEDKINGSQKILEKYLQTLKHAIYSKLVSVKNILIQRLSDDMSYEWRKHKKRPSEQRVEGMIQTAIKDGIVEIMREYRYEFSKELNVQMEGIEFGQIADLNSKKLFDSNEFFKKYFDINFATTNLSITNQRAYGVLKGTKKGDKESYLVGLDEVFKDTFEQIYAHINSSLASIDAHLLDEFVGAVKKPLDEYKEQIFTKERLLNDQLKNLHSNKQNTQNELMSIDAKIERLTQISANVKEALR